MVRSGRSPGLTPTDCAAAAMGFAMAERPAAANPAEAPRKLRRDRFSFTFFSSYCAPGNAKERIFAPDAIATYCFPSTSYVIGEALMKAFFSKCHRYLPVAAS